MKSQLRIPSNYHPHHGSHPGLNVTELLAQNQQLQNEKYELQQLNSALKRKKLQPEECCNQKMELQDIEDRNSFNSDAFIDNITTTQQALNRHRQNIDSFCGEIQSWETHTKKLRSKSTNLEKDMLMYRSYVLLSQLEQEKELLMIGDCAPSPNPHDKLLDLKDCWEGKMEQVKERTVSLQSEVATKGEYLNTLKYESEFMHTKVEELVSQARNFQDALVATNTENSRLLTRIKELEGKQKDVQEMLLMESEFKKLHSSEEKDCCDTGLLIAEKRLGMIQKSYECLAHEVLHKEEAIVQRDLQIEKLEHYIRKKEESCRGSSRQYSGFQSSDIVDQFMAGDTRVNKSSVDNIENDQVQKLMWLVTALRKKLKKRKDLDRKFQLDKEILVNTVSTMSYTWEELRKCCENLRTENLYLKHKLEALSICASPPSPVSYNPLPITCNLDQESSRENGEHRKSLVCQSEATALLSPIPQPDPSTKYPLLEDTVDTSFITNSIYDPEMDTSTPKEADVMSRVLLVLEQCVQNVTQLLESQGPLG